MEAFGRRLPYLATGLAVIALDRLTKLMVESSLSPWRSVPIVPGWFDLTYVRNPGGVFGVFKGLSEGTRGVLFTVVPLTAIVLILAYALRVPASRRLTQTSLAMILGGAIGNLIDRFAYGHVIDFLDFYWRDHHWPAFNVADSAICVGVGVLMIESLLSGERAAPLDAGAPPASPAGPPTVRHGGDAP